MKSWNTASHRTIEDIKSMRINKIILGEINANVWQKVSYKLRPANLSF